MVSRKFVLLSLFTLLSMPIGLASAGIIKDIFHKVTNSNNKTEDTVKQSAPICGNGIFSTPDETSLSPEIIFISNRPARSEATDSNDYGGSLRNKERNSNYGRGREEISEVANEFTFHTENVTLEELERHGFNPNAPVSFLMHGFTSGYPLQAWISAIVEAYTIDRESSNVYSNSRHQYRDQDNNYTGSLSSLGEHYRRTNQQSIRQSKPTVTGGRVNHNLFVVNWNYAARGILYTRAVANIPIVASYVTRFINEKLIDEARVDPHRIQLVGHSLGAHLAGFIGKNTRSKLGRIYGLDPAGPCFGALSGPLYPSSKRLAPDDADQVISIHTNAALLGIDKPLGKYSVFVEGGDIQPGCKGGGVLKSIGTLTWDGGDFDTIACSHSRAPNLLTYRHDQGETEDDCQMVAYVCKDWQSFSNGQCGLCHSSGDGLRNHQSSQRDKPTSGRSPMDPVECLRIGLDWQYPSTSSAHSTSSSQIAYQRPHSNEQSTTSSTFGHQREDYGNNYSRRTSTTTRRPTLSVNNDYDGQNTGYNSNFNSGTRPNYTINNSWSSKRLNQPASNWNGRAKRAATSGNENIPSGTETSERRSGDSVEPISMFLRTGDTQPYCVFHYQVILELNEPFKDKKPPMSIILQDSKSETDEANSRRRGGSRGEQNSLSSDEFGNRFNEKIYTHLLISAKRLKQIDHGTLIFRDGLPDGHRILKWLHINYMSHSSASVRQRFAARLCPVKTETDRSRESANRFYFRPCQHHWSGQHQDNPSDSGRDGHAAAHHSGHKPGQPGAGYQDQQQSSGWAGGPSNKQDDYNRYRNYSTYY